MAAASFFVRRGMTEFDRLRDQVNEQDRAAQRAERAALELGRQIATEYVRVDDLKSLRDEFTGRCDRIDDRLERIWEEIRKK